MVSIFRSLEIGAPRQQTTTSHSHCVSISSTTVAVIISVALVICSSPVHFNHHLVYCDTNWQTQKESLDSLSLHGRLTKT